MPHLQRLATPLLVVSALIAAVTLVTAPASAQNEGVKVFVIGNDMVNDEDKEERWEMQVTARAVGGCTPTRGDVGYSSPWIETGAEVAAELSLGECVFRISVTLRQASSPVDCWYTAQLRWGELAEAATPTDDYVFTSDRPDDVSRISAVRKATSHCAYPTEMRFYVNGAALVEDLPGPSANVDLLALAKRAAEISAFEVRLVPDRSAGSVPAGCDRTGTFTVHGDGQRVRHSLQSTGAPCQFQASIVKADAPFEAVQDRTVAFADNARIINLTSLARLPQARIAIIQSVEGSANQGTASYNIARFCGDNGVTSPAGTVESTALQEGRFTVHAPHAPAFGATAIYPAVAADEDADTIVGCSVRVSVRDLPFECVVDGGSSQTLTWTESAPISKFDFEFDIRCGAATPTTTTTAARTPTTTTTEAAVPEDAVDMIDPSEADTDAGTTAEEPSDDGPLFDMPTG